MTSTFSFPHTTPEAAGIPSAAVLAFVQSLEEHAHPLDAPHGFMLLRGGRVAAEGWWAPYGPQQPHTLYSLSKSFTSTAIGLAVAEGRLTVDDPVLQFFGDDAPAAPSEHLRAMRVRDLLAMNTGHHADTTDRVFGCGHRNWPRAFLSLPVEHQPGTWFVYNTAATYMLSAIITRLTGQPVLDYLRSRLFEPLGIANPTWETDPRGISLGGTGLHLTTGDIARFGQLFLQGGQWQGQQIVPAAWVAEATAAHSDNSNTQTNPDWSVGYGYQFWRCRHNAYRGDGAFGQFCLIMPEQDAVLAINSGLRDMQAVLDKVWEHLLPAMRPNPLPADPEAHAQLCAKLASLSLPLATGTATVPAVAGWAGKRYTLAPNDLKLASIALHSEASGGQGSGAWTLVIGAAGGEQTVPVGDGAWARGVADLRGRSPEPVAASGAWTAGDAFTVHTCFYAGEFCPVLRLHFAGDTLQLEVDPNVAWGEPAPVIIAGHAAG